MIMLGFIAVFSVFTVMNAVAQDSSTIIVPFSAPLSGLESYANTQLPSTLHEESRGQQCVEPQRACTKIPEFRGFKIYSRMECVTITPAIDCNLSQKAWREGPLSISGQGEVLTFQQSVRGTATVRGRGEIGRHISETANGAARLTVRATPKVNPDWSLSMPIEHSIAWLEAPNVVLFNVLPVTFQTQADNALNSAINTFKNRDLPQELARLNLRERVLPLWSQLQMPYEIELPDGAALYLHFRPEHVGMAPLHVSGRQLETALFISGQTTVLDTKLSPFAEGPTELPSLSPTPGRPGFSLTVPLEVGLDTLTNAIAGQLPHSLDLGDPASGTILIKDSQLANDNGLLAVQLDVDVQALGFDAYQGPMTLTGVPHWHAEETILKLSDPVLKVSDNGLVATLLNAVLETSAMQRWLNDQLRFSVGPQIEMLEAQLHAALNRPLSPGIQLRGDAALSVTDLAVDETLRLTVRAEGVARVDGLSLR